MVKENKVTSLATIYFCLTSKVIKLYLIFKKKKNIYIYIYIYIYIHFKYFKDPEFPLRLVISPSPSTELPREYHFKML